MLLSTHRVSLMPEFSKGGIIHGEVNIFIKMVTYPSWYGGTSSLGNGMFVMYADECLIGIDKVCRRKDEMHRRFAPGDYPQGQWRFWFCPIHDKEDRRGQAEPPAPDQRLPGAD